MACESEGQIQDVFKFKHSKLVLPRNVSDAFKVASSTTEGNYFLIGSGARKCFMNDADTIKEFDFIGDFNLDRIQRQYGSELIRRWDQYRALKIGWNGIEIDFIARKDIIKALQGSDITLSLLCIDNEGVVYDPLGIYEDFRREQVRIENATEKIQVSPERILRVVRFAADLGYGVEGNTLQACKSNACLMTADNTEYALKQFIQSQPRIRDRAIQLSEEFGIIGELRRVVEDKSHTDLVNSSEFQASKDRLGKFLGISDFFIFGGTIRDVLLGKQIRDFDVKFENKVADMNQIVRTLSAMGFIPTNDVRLPQGSYFINSNFNVVSFRLEGLLYDLSFTGNFDPNKWRKESDVNLNAMVFDNGSERLLNRGLSFDVAMRRLALCNPFDPNIDPLKIINALKQMARIEKLTVEDNTLNTIKTNIPLLIEYFQSNPHLLYKLNSILGQEFTQEVVDLIHSCPGSLGLLQLLEN